MSDWQQLLAGNQQACPTVGARLTALNDVLFAAYQMEPRGRAEERELERLEREVVTAAGATRCVGAGVGDGIGTAAQSGADR